MKKAFICYMLFSVFGIIIDELLVYFDYVIPYSFLVLFLNICLYKIKLNQEETISNSYKILTIVFGFMICPILFGLLMVNK